MSRYQSPTRGIRDDDCYLQERALTTLIENKKMLMQTDRTLAKSQQTWTGCGPEYIPFDVFQKQMAIKNGQVGRRRSNSPKGTWQNGSHHGNGTNPRQSSPYGTGSQANNSLSLGKGYSSGNLCRESPERLSALPPNEGFSRRRESTSPQKKNYSSEGQKNEGKGYEPYKTTSEKTKDACEMSNSTFPEISKVPEMSPERKRQHRSQSRSRAFAHSEFSNNSPVQQNFDDDCDAGMPTEREIELETSISDVSLSLSEPPSLSKYLPTCGSTSPERPKSPPQDWVQKYLHRKSKYQRALSRLVGGTEEACRKKALEEENNRCKDANTKPGENKDVFDSIQKDKGGWFLYRREYQQFFNDGSNNHTCNATSGRDIERISSPGLAKIILGTFNPSGEGKARESGYANAIQLRTTSSVPGMQIYSSKQHDECNSAVIANMKSEKQNAAHIPSRVEAHSPLKTTNVETPKPKTEKSTENRQHENSTLRFGKKEEAIIKQKEQTEKLIVHQKDTDQPIRETTEKKATTSVSPRKTTSSNTAPTISCKSPSRHENKSPSKSPRKLISMGKTVMASTTANVLNTTRNDRSRSKSPSKKT